MLISACMPMTQGLFKRYTSPKMMSYLSLFGHSTSPASNRSGSKKSELTHQVELKPGQGRWTKLVEDSSLNHFMTNGHTGTSIQDGNEAIESWTDTGAFRKDNRPTKAHDIV